jgi:acyl-CoA thioesterase
MLDPMSRLDTPVRQRLDAAIDLLDEAQQQRLLEWAGVINARVPDARAPGASIGPLGEMMRITSEAADPGCARYALRVTPELLNPHGVLHGGAVYTMVDYSMGAATMSVLPAGDICATIEIKVNYLAGVRDGTLTCETQIVKQGRRVVFLESRVRQDSGRLAATASGSFAIIRQDERDEARGAADG